jgi:nanoRNase/pAp phosphatase (c-di-AMP/oligoRNAs hydrolase)
MVERLLLGSGSLVVPVAENAGPLTVGTPDEQLVSTLVGAGVSAEHLDPTDEQALASLDADIVLVVEDTAREALSTTTAARSAFPEAYLLVCPGERTAGDGLVSAADRVLDPEQAVVSRFLDTAGEPGLWAVLRSIDRLAVVTHDNPDPDAIASGTALAELAADAGCEAEVCYYGEIGHQENRALVNVLDIDLRPLDPDTTLSSFDGFALVDHARPGVNDQLPPETPVDIIIDHHPTHAPVEARFVNHCSNVGATSTLLVESFERTGRDLDTATATALLFGIQVDTHGFVRGVAPRDFEAAATLAETADVDTLERIESPSVDRGTFDVLADAIDNRRLEGDVLFSPVGRIQNRDVLPQVADRLLTVEGVQATLVYGIIDETVYVSARSRAEGPDLGRAMRDAFARLGSAGGHAEMAGAQIELGQSGETGSPSADTVDALVVDRFLEAVSTHSRRATPAESDHARLSDTTDDADRSGE